MMRHETKQDELSPEWALRLFTLPKRCPFCGAGTVVGVHKPNKIMNGTIQIHCLKTLCLAEMSELYGGNFGLTADQAAEKLIACWNRRDGVPDKTDEELVEQIEQKLGKK